MDIVLILPFLIILFVLSIVIWICKDWLCVIIFGMSIMFVVSMFIGYILTATEVSSDVNVIFEYKSDENTIITGTVSFATTSLFWLYLSEGNQIKGWVYKNEFLFNQNYRPETKKETALIYNEFLQNSFGKINK